MLRIVPLEIDPADVVSEWKNGWSRRVQTGSCPADPTLRKMGSGSVRVPVYVYVSLWIEFLYVYLIT